MSACLTSLPPWAAIGYSLAFLLLGGGIGGAFVIYILAKLFRK